MDWQLNSSVPGEEKDYKLVEVDNQWFLKVVPCQSTCPCLTDVPAYIALIAEGRFEEAYEVNKKANLFPSVLGRVCNHPCEKACRRNLVDEPVAICNLKRYAADRSRNRLETTPSDRTQSQSVAVIGAGPVGLTCANDLVRQGYQVTVFEASSVIGGMLYQGIPEYRLPRDVLQMEVDLRKAGVEIRLNERIGDRITFFELQNNYDAIFLASGAHKGLKLNIAGEDRYEGFLDCIDFLKNVNLGERVSPGSRIVVIGGGNSAIDTARTALRLRMEGGPLADEVVLQAADSARAALRLGSSEVTIIYRRSREEMPANTWEIEEAEHEGVRIEYLTAPVRVLGSDGKITGIECVRMELAEPDASGRRRPVPIEASNFTVDCDVIISAISQSPDLSFLEPGQLELTRWDTVQVDSTTMATSLPGVFAGGDVVTGPRTVIEGIAHGHQAAETIARYLKNLPIKENRGCVAARLAPGRPPRFQPDYLRIPRQDIVTLDLDDRLSGFQEVELGYTDELAQLEASRCLQCFYNIFVDAANCILCGGCVDVCPYDCFEMISADRIDGVPQSSKVEGGTALVLDEDVCVRCGTCVDRCPTGAITMQKFEIEEVCY